MKLVLLPGMDGTGILFEAVLPELLKMNTVVLTLPKSGAQDYLTLSKHVVKHLPDESFILVAESFSGGIAAAMSSQDIPNLKGIIFVASFLSAPKRLLARIMSWLPVRNIAKLPMASLAHRLFCLGWDADNKELGQFLRAIEAVPSSTLKSRLKVIASSKFREFKSAIPAVYIGASRDKLVSSGKKKEFKKAYPKIVFTEVEGPHFVLQTQPKAGAAAIIEAVQLLTNKGSG
ncbi:MAG: alpha/beta hydrolase [Neptuniibacter sp.]